MELIRKWSVFHALPAARLTSLSSLSERKGIMTLSNLLGRTGRTLAATAAIVGAIGLVAVPKPAHALSPGEGVAIGLGALAVGSVLGAASTPYYGYPGYYGYYGAPAYYGYGYGPGPRSCWNPYYGRYYPC